MTNEEIDALWFEAMRISIQKGDGFTRFEFARLVAAAEREACAEVCDAEFRFWRSDMDRAAQASCCAKLIRARGTNE